MAKDYNQRMTKLIEVVCEFTIRNRLAFLIVLGSMTLALGIVVATQTKIESYFPDLLPQDHPYIKINEKYKETFGGSNMITIMMEAKEGNIFTTPFLQKIKNLQFNLREVPGVNQFQVISIAGRKLKMVKASTAGVETRPFMDKETYRAGEGVPQTQKELDQLRDAILTSRTVYGTYVSKDLRSVLITVDFIDRLLEYTPAFNKINEILDKERDDTVRIRVVGEPMLYGWVHYYFPETMTIFMLTWAALLAFLFLVMRTWRGTLLPLLSGLVSGTWALGIVALMGFNFDPLVIVVAFLLTATAISHSLQLTVRFDDNVNAGYTDMRKAALQSMTMLTRPLFLGLATSAGAILVVALTPIPLLEKVAITGTIWVFTIIISAYFLTPLLLSYVKNPKAVLHPVDLQPAIFKFLNLAVSTATARGSRKWVLIAALVIFIMGGVMSFNLTVGDANSGSPILWVDSKYNIDSDVINTTYRGADRMFIVVRGPRNTLKSPKILRNMANLQRFMEAQPEIGGSVSLADLLPAIQRVFYEGNPRFYEIGDDILVNGELAYLYLSGSEPGDADKFNNFVYSEGSIRFMFRDHRGTTIRTGIARLKDYIAENPLELEKDFGMAHEISDYGGGISDAVLGGTGKREAHEGGTAIGEIAAQAHPEYYLAGGLIGVLGAVNEVILAKQLESIALALLWIGLCAAAIYRNASSALFFMVPVALSNVITFSYMTMKGIGMNINTVPVAALGIALGVDYAFYIADGIREELRETRDPMAAIIKALHSAGRGVLITASTLVISIILWTFSSVRFQAEMGALMCVWLTISALSALFVIPAMAYVFRPEFIFGVAGSSAEPATAPASGS
ncbi:MAG: RND transporter [Rhodospirillaceae bacterium]|nr:MAG: RND transporter [Rhodospirillaceae bacterium]